MNNENIEIVPEVVEVEKVGLTMQQQYSRNLRALADWYEQHPNAPIDTAHVYKTNYQFEASAEEIRAIGAGEKVFIDTMFYYRVKSEFFSLEWAELRQNICTPKVVGKKIIPSYYSPEREEDVIEWECPKALLATEGEAEGE